MEPHDIYLHSEALDTVDDLRAANTPMPRIGLAVTYDDIFGWRIWTTSLINLLWMHLTESRMHVVGWDVLHDDLPMIQHAVGAPDSPAALDLSAQIKAATGRVYTLDTIARANLNRGKVIDTRSVIEWLKLGDALSMSKATEHCRSSIQLVMELAALIRHGKPLLLPGRVQRGYGATPRTEAVLQLWFTPAGEWARYEDTRGRVLGVRASQLPDVTADL